MKTFFLLTSLCAFFSTEILFASDQINRLPMSIFEETILTVIFAEERVDLTSNHVDFGFIEITYQNGDCVTYVLQEKNAYPHFENFFKKAPQIISNVMATGSMTNLVRNTKSVLHGVREISFLPIKWRDLNNTVDNSSIFQRYAEAGATIRFAENNEIITVSKNGWPQKFSCDEIRDIINEDILSTIRERKPPTIEDSVITALKDFVQDKKNVEIFRRK